MGSGSGGCWSWWPEVAAFARQVRDGQHAEMVRMQRYLAEWFGGSGMPCPM
ncbi:hypothetical protein ACWDA3_59840 [Nonomuraea rubra]